MEYIFALFVIELRTTSCSPRPCLRDVGIYHQTLDRGKIAPYGDIY